MLLPNQRVCRRGKWRDEVQKTCPAEKGLECGIWLTEERRDIWGSTRREASTKPCSLERLLQRKQWSVACHGCHAIMSTDCSEEGFFNNFPARYLRKAKQPCRAAEPPQTPWSSLGGALGLHCPVHTRGDSFPVHAANSSRTGRCIHSAPAMVSSSSSLCLPRISYQSLSKIIILHNHLVKFYRFQRILVSSWTS